MPNPGRGSLERLRLSNRRAVLNVLGSTGALSRADIARATGLSRTTVSSLVHEMLATGLVAEAHGRGRPHKGGSGRPSTLLTLTAPPGLAVGVDLGHRHIRVAVADQTSTVLAEREAQFDVDHDGRTALDTAARMLREVLDDAGVATGRVMGVGLCIPGPIHRQTGKITSSILPGWRGLRPGPELEERIGMPVIVDNDANVGALGELNYGAAQGLTDVIYLKVAAGVGAGLILGGRLHRGTTGIAGEIGHVQLREDGPVCRCGNRGCLETQVSAARLLRLLQPAHEQELTLETVLDLDSHGDAGVNRVLNDAGRVIGRALADLCNNLNPAAIIVGGSMGESAALLRGTRDSVGRYAQPQTAEAVRVSPGSLGRRAEVMGALAMAIDQHAAPH